MLQNYYVDLLRIPLWLIKLPVIFRTNFDLNVFVHSPGNEIWLSYAIFPLDVTNVRLVIIQIKT